MVLSETSLPVCERMEAIKATRIATPVSSAAKAFARSPRPTSLMMSLPSYSPFQRRAEDRLQAVDRHQDRIGKAATHRTPLIAEFVVLAEAAVKDATRDQLT